MQNCHICDKPFDKRVIAGRQYCNVCRPFVHQVQVKAQRVMARADLPSARAYECSDCGVPATDYDHRYYSMPLEVDPVCSKCNTNRGPALDVRQLTRDLMGIFDLPEPPKPRPSDLRAAEIPKDLAKRLDDIERAYIVAALEESRHNKTQAAKLLGITFRSMRYRLDRLQIDA